MLDGVGEGVDVAEGVRDGVEAGDGERDAERDNPVVHEGVGVAVEEGEGATTVTDEDVAET